MVRVKKWKIKTKRRSADAVAVVAAVVAKSVPADLTANADATKNRYNSKIQSQISTYLKPAKRLAGFSLKQNVIRFLWEFHRIFLQQL